MSDVVERGKAALEGVTEGSWETRSDYKEPTRVVFSGEVEFSLFQCCDCPVEAGAVNPKDAEFIASARSLVPELIAEVERHRATLAEIHTKAVAWGTDHRLPQEVAVISARLIQITNGAGDE